MAGRYEVGNDLPPVNLLSCRVYCSALPVMRRNGQAGRHEVENDLPPVNLLSCRVYCSALPVMRRNGQTWQGDMRLEMIYHQSIYSLVELLLCSASDEKEWTVMAGRHEVENDLPPVYLLSCIVYCSALPVMRRNGQSWQGDMSQPALLQSVLLCSGSDEKEWSEMAGRHEVENDLPPVNLLSCRVYCSALAVMRRNGQKWQGDMRLKMTHHQSTCSLA
ncbi:hypothetical protein J6590_010416 [Homalodisca vitripennis]|nr:hypothetical protein J6590_010416 [Homalodisca vitripennis]